MQLKYKLFEKFLSIVSALINLQKQKLQLRKKKKRRKYNNCSSAKIKIFSFFIYFKVKTWDFWKLLILSKPFCFYHY